MPSKFNNRGFQTLLYYKLILKKQYNAQQTAKAMNLSPSTFYHYISGEQTFPVDLVAPLYNVTGDPEFLNFILNDTNMMLTPRQKSNPKKDVIQETLDVGVAMGMVIKQVQQAYEDGDINQNEKESVIGFVNSAHMELEELRGKINESK